ncbi:M16 family metallopeptidase [Leptothermofonsia sp. ETS-13]|uniref:M16 family metallopeptidase n=1 Tax=Leptothermofonsia sp. ETS-13 TaxID=3035696 RepID=UPI003B9EC305
MQEPRNQTQKAKILVLVFCFIVIPLILFLLAIRPAFADNIPKHYTDLTFPPLPEVKLPEYTRFQLGNGMVVYLMEDHELPLVGGTALIRTGSRLEPAEKVGLASIMGSVMRTGGTQFRSPDEVNEFLEQRAASIETGVGEVSGSASFSALSENLEEVFDLFAEIVRQPAFPQDKIDLAKTQARGGIARRNDDPNGIASREFRKLIYGDNSPYARTVEYATLDNISRDDIVGFYQQYYSPGNVLLGITGDFNSKTMRKLIEEKFGDWKPGTKTNSSLPSVTQAKTGGIFLVNQPQLSQSSILVGHLGGLVNSPDYPALSVMNEVLNGFGGRLFNEVRSRQGLAYSVYGIWNPRYDYPGTFTAGGQTRSDATVSFVKSILAEIERIRTQPISNTELSYAKDSVLNSFIFNFEDPSQTLSRLLRYEYFGYPSDFLFRYRRGVEATTIADVQRVAKTYLQPEKIVTLVVGNERDINPPLSTLSPNAEVTAIDISIPPPRSS